MDPFWDQSARGIEACCGDDALKVKSDPSGSRGGCANEQKAFVPQKIAKKDKAEKELEKKRRKAKKSVPWAGLFFVLTVVTAVIIFVGLETANITPTTFNVKDIPEPPKLVKSLTVLERIGENGLNSPGFFAFGKAGAKVEVDKKHADEEKEEPIVVEVTEAPPHPKRDAVFATLRNGSLALVDLATGEGEHVAYTGRPRMLREGFACGEWYTEGVCGRPTGMAFDQDGLRIFLVDSYNGLHLFNPSDGRLEVLVEEMARNKPWGTLSEVVVSPHTGIVYILESSTIHQRRDETKVFWEAASTGRILKFDPEFQSIEVVSNKLVGPTGMALVPKKGKGGVMYDDALLVAEPLRARVRQISLPTKERKEKKVFNLAQNLPVYPHSLKFDYESKTLWVGGHKRNTYIDSTSKYPAARKLLSLFAFTRVDLLFKPEFALLKLDPKGKIQAQYNDDSGELTGATNFDFHDGFLYVSSERDYWNGIAKVEMSK